MSKFSRVLLIATALAAYIYLIYAKGVPHQDSPNPQAFLDVVLQPALAVVWGLLGYLVTSAFFAILVLVAVKLARLVVEFVIDPIETIRRFQALRASVDT